MGKIKMQGIKKMAQEAQKQLYTTTKEQKSVVIHLFTAAQKRKLRTNPLHPDEVALIQHLMRTRHKNRYRLRCLNINIECINVEEFGLMYDHEKILKVFVQFTGDK